MSIEMSLMMSIEMSLMMSIEMSLMMSIKMSVIGWNQPIHVILWIGISCIISLIGLNQGIIVTGE